MVQTETEVFVVNYEGGPFSLVSEEDDHYELPNHPNNFIYWSNGEKHKFTNGGNGGSDPFGNLYLGSDDPQ